MAQNYYTTRKEKKKNSEDLCSHRCMFEDNKAHLTITTVNMFKLINYCQIIYLLLPKLSNPR